MSGRRSPELEAAESPDLTELHGRLVAAYRGDLAGIQGGVGLDVLAAGEISVVLRWTDGDRSWAIRPLPPFPSPAAFEVYHGLFRQYLDQLADIGIPLVPSGLMTVWGRGPPRATAAPPPRAGCTAAPGDPPPDRGGPHESRSYCLQPLLPAGAIGPAFLRTSAPAAAGAFLDRVLALTRAAVTPRRGLDAQASNWAVLEGEVHYLDVTTPLLRDDEGRERLDSELWVAALPALLRPPLRALVVPQLLSTYYDSRQVLVDFAGNLIKEDLETFVTPWLDRANPGLDRPITLAEVRRYIRFDRLQWSTLQVLRRLDRAWRHLRREPYPFLLP